MMQRVRHSCGLQTARADHLFDLLFTVGTVFVAGLRDWSVGAGLTAGILAYVILRAWSYLSGWFCRPLIRLELEGVVNEHKDKMQEYEKSKANWEQLLSKVDDDPWRVEEWLYKDAVKAYSDLQNESDVSRVAEMSLLHSVETAKQRLESRRKGECVSSGRIQDLKAILHGGLHQEADKIARAQEALDEAQRHLAELF